MMQTELDALLKAQQCHYGALTDAVCKKLKEMVFEEAEPKTPSIGKCRYGVRGADDEVETRLPRGSDLFQRKRIYEEVNNLRLISSRTAEERPLDRTQRDRLAALLLDGSDLTAAGVRKHLGLGKEALADKTSLDISDRRKGRKTAGKLQGHPLADAMARADALELWRGLDDDRREEIAGLVRTEDDEEALRTGLKAFGLPPAAIGKLSDARLPTTYSAAGKTATRKLLTELEADVISHHEAETRAGLESLDRPPRLDRLPYYGNKILQSWCVGGNDDPGGKNEARFGRIPNPVVHVALNQLRKTANAYLRLYGKPARICIELARDLNRSAEAREEIEKEAAQNRRRNEDYIEELGAHTRKITGEDRQRIKLHGMQDGECLYTGKPISMQQLFDGSVQVDHILPYADTHDPGIANLALAFTEANRFKAKRPPFQAFSAGYRGQDYAHILARATKRGKGVLWRFSEDAMERYKDRDAFEARFMGDTRYIARMAARYLECVCADPNGVVSLNGRITSDLRRKWCLHTLIRDIMVAEGRLDDTDMTPPKGGETLEETRERRKRADKMRWDHRHHLFDAVVAACTTRSDVQRLQTLAARHTNGESASKILSQVCRADAGFRNAGVCWKPGFREAVKAFLQGKGRDLATGEAPITRVTVKADHDTRGQLHEATNYGVICEAPGKPGHYVVRDHVALTGLTAKQIEELGGIDVKKLTGEQIETLRDPAKVKALKAERIEEYGVFKTAIAAAEKAARTGARIWWGGDRPAASLRNLARDVAILRANLLQLMDETPSEVLEPARTDGGREKARANWAVAEYIRRTGRRRYTRVQVRSLRILKGPLRPDGKPRQSNPTGGNDRLVCFIDGNDDRRLEVVSTLDANRPAFRERWRCEGGRLLFALRKNDLVEMLEDPKDPAAPRRLYRTASFSGAVNPDLEFVPVEEARPARPPKHLRIRSVKAFLERAPVVVVCDPTGRERWRSPRLN